FPTRRSSDLEIADRGVLVHELIELLGCGLGELDMPGGSAPAVTAVVFDESDANGAVGGRLQPAVDRGDHLVAGAFGRRTEALPQLEPRHLRYVGSLHVEQR